MVDLQPARMGRAFAGLAHPGPKLHSAGDWQECLARFENCVKLRLAHERLLSL
jgi:hypothetical protein